MKAALGSAFGLRKPTKGKRKRVWLEGNPVSGGRGAEGVKLPEQPLDDMK